MVVRGRSTVKVVAVKVVAVMALVAAACGSSEPDGADATQVTEAGTTEVTDASPGTTGATATDDDPTAVPVDSPDTASAELEIATVSLPDGLRPWWETTNRSAPFSGDVFVLAASSDVAIGAQQPSLQILRLDVALEWTRVEVSIPAAATSVDMFMTGSRLAVSYLDPAGEIVVLTSVDGADFAETRLPVPERYVAADTWAATSLIGRVQGAADLGEGVFAIVNTGLLWRRPNDIAEDYAVEQAQDPEVAENIRAASTIRGSPTGDGDMLFTFEKGGEVVGEVLGSDAGIESGYIDAYNNRTGASFESQSWMIEGNTSRNLDTPPFGGQEGLRFHALYPIDGGVGALVTDFNLAAAEAAILGTPGIYAAAAPEALARGSNWGQRTYATNNGRDWEGGKPLDAPNANFRALAWGDGLYVLVVEGEAGVGVATSANGSNWGNVDYTLDISLPGGGSVQIYVIDGKNFLVNSPGEGKSTKYSADAGGTGSVEQESESDLPELEPEEFWAMFQRLDPVDTFLFVLFAADPV